MTLIATKQAEIVSRLQRGDSVSAISTALRVRRPTISSLAKKNKILVRRGRPHAQGTPAAPCTRQRIIALFWKLHDATEIESLEQVAQQIGVSRAYVSAVLSREDIAAAELIAMVRMKRAGKPGDHIASSQGAAKDEGK